MKNLTWLALASLTALACADSIPLDAMPCPCTDGFVCCALTNQCVAPDSPCVAPPSGPGPACGPGRDAGSGSVAIVNSPDTLVVPVSCNVGNAAPNLFKYAPGYTPDPALQAQVQALMSQMTIKDKADQMRGMPYGAAERPNFTDNQRSPNTAGIRGFTYRDGPRGINLGEDMYGTSPTAAIVNGSSVGLSTAFPVSIARGASFDLDLEYAVGEAIGDEMQAAGQSVALAPLVNVLRNPLWGRTQESYGEDPFHVGRLASAMTVGIQQHVAATAKAYMAYDIENGRDFNNSILDEQTLRETYGRHFRMVVQDGGVAAVMASYNLVNGVKSTENKHTLTDVLRDDFGFKGFVMSDWWAMRPSAYVGGVDASTLKAYAVYGLTAGLDVELPWALNYGQLETLATSVPLAAAQIDVSVGRILEQKLRFNAHPLTGPVGLGMPQTRYSDSRIYCDADHVALAEQAALESMVLLKNDNATLPIKAVTKVAVLGATVPVQYRGDAMTRTTTLDFAKDTNTGDMGTSRVFHDPAKGIGPFAGIAAAAPAGVKVVAGSRAADAAGADFVVVVAGLTAGDEGEEYTLAGDRMSFGLDAKETDPTYSQRQNDLIRSAAALGKPMVVVLQGSSVIDMPWLPSVPAVVMAFYPGMVGGAALGKLLWGEVNGQKFNFSGKLPFTWSAVGDYGTLKSDSGSTFFDYYVGYRSFDHYGLSPLFPFGYGQSYTSFEYRKLQLGCSDMSQGAVLPVAVNVANTGTVAGDEVVMVFVAFPDTTARRPAKELKGFARVHLEAGEEKQVTIPIRLADLDYFDATLGKWVVETGNVKIMVGGSSANLPLSGMVQVNGY
jgi:beta-glucosidase